ncbi:MAG: Crp/Fnr family transcriptional regulator [Chloroflexota bacterium]
MQPIALNTASVRAVSLGELLGLDVVAAEAIAASARISTVRAGSVLHAPGSPASGLLVLLDGSVRIYRMDVSGAETVLGMVEPGDVFGEAHSGVHASYAEAMAPSVVCTLDAPALERLTGAHPRVALRLLAALAERINGMADQLERAARWGVRERLIALLLRHAGPNCEVRGLTHEQVAASIWASRQTVTQELSALAADGLVAVGRRRVLLRQPAALRALITGDSPPRRGQRQR